MSQFREISEIKMKTTILLFCCCSFINSGLGRKIAIEANFDVKNGIQIVSPTNHSFRLELNDLKKLLEADDIKDRKVVVVSIAGPLRKGKSFLLNFFVKYLDAQVGLI